MKRHDSGTFTRHRKYHAIPCNSNFLYVDKDSSIVEKTKNLMFNKTHVMFGGSKETVAAEYRTDLHSESAGTLHVSSLASCNTVVDNAVSIITTDSDEDSEGMYSDQRTLLLSEASGVETLTDCERASNEGEQESSNTIMVQVLLPYLIAGFGMVGAGFALDVVQHTPVFTNVQELFILVPALLGLKGNLEMTLASRLSTQSNIGNMDTGMDKCTMVKGNMALIQAQATIVGFLASMFAMVIGWVPNGQFPMNHALLLCASSLFTANVASFALGSLMSGVVFLSRFLSINPDNVSIPIAASLGDLTTLALLSSIASLLYSEMDIHAWLAPSIISVCLVMLPFWLVVSLRNKYTNEVVYSCWTPVLCAMIISSMGGIILDIGVHSNPGIAVFQPVINGVGGNLVAVHASRASTYLHRHGIPGQAPSNMSVGCGMNCATFLCDKSLNARAARVLLLLVVPGHLIFTYSIYYMSDGHIPISILFLIFYLTAAVVQVLVLMYMSQWMVSFIWRLGGDPDNVAIPYLTALGDLLGTLFLVAAFWALHTLGDQGTSVEN